MDFRKVTPDSINYIKTVSMTEQARLYIKLTKLHRVACQNVWFNQQCKRLNVIPNYIHIRTNTQSRAAKTAINKAEVIWLNEETRHWFTVRDNYKLHLKVLYYELSFKMHNIEFDCLDEKARHFASIEVHSKYLSQTKKLKNLAKLGHNANKDPKDRQPFTDHCFHPRVKNLTNVQLSNTEKNLLEKGLKYNVTPNISQKQIETLAVDAEIATVANKKDNLVKGVVANQIKNINTQFSFNPEIKALKSLKETVETNNLVISKADKGNTVVIIDRDDYINKVNDVINCEDFVQLRSDPTNKFAAKIRLSINNTKYLFRTEYSKRRQITMNPRAPTLYGLPKIHKPDIPMRPVVSYIGAPAYELAKSLNLIIKQKMSFRPPYALKNSLELINHIKDITLPARCKLISLDVDSLFTNIPCKETLHILNNSLEKHLPTHECKEIIRLTQICTEQNYFRFNKHFYIQKDGLAMGSPLSPLLAEIFMDHFEQKYIAKNTNILYYYRYVDDCILCWTGTDRQLDAFTKELNKKHTKIKFKVEREISNTLNFLDLSITREKDRHIFGIYRKETYTDTTIPKSSCHPWQHKLAAFHSYIHRLMSVPLSKENYNKELNIIKEIAFANGYNPQIVSNIIKKKNKKQLRECLYAVKPDKDVKKYKSSLTYMGPVSERIAKVLKSQDVNVAYKTNNSLRQICNNKDKLDIGHSSGIYKLQCSECNGCYIGQTGRNFKTRYKEHLAAFRNGHPQKSHFAKHLIDTGHNLANNHAYQALHKCDKSFRLDVLEQLEIIKHNGDNRFALLNEQRDLTSSPIVRLFGGGGGVASSN